MNFPENLKYTKEHEWVSVEGDIATVGITEYAQGELGDVVFVEMPAEGSATKANESFGTIEAVKAVSDLFSPVTGSVTEVNKELETVPETINKDPYVAGWIVKIKMVNMDELAGMLDAAAYKALIGK